MIMIRNRLVTMAKAGNIKAIDMIVERRGGRVRQALDLSGEVTNGQPHAIIDYSRLNETTLKEILVVTTLEH